MSKGKLAIVLVGIAIAFIVLNTVTIVVGSCAARYVLEEMRMHEEFRMAHERSASSTGDVHAK